LTCFPMKETEATTIEETNIAAPKRPPVTMSIGLDCTREEMEVERSGAPLPRAKIVRPATSGLMCKASPITSSVGVKNLSAAVPNR